MTEQNREISTPIPDSAGDAFLYRLLIGGLVAFILVLAVGSILLAWFAKPIPTELLALGGVALGGLIAPIARKAMT